MEGDAGPESVYVKTPGEALLTLGEDVERQMLSVDE